MPSPKCPASNCNSTSFELTNIQIDKAKHRYHCIACASCGAVATVIYPYNLLVALEKIAKAVGVRLD